MCVCVCDCGVGVSLMSLSTLADLHCGQQRHGNHTGTHTLLQLSVAIYTVRLSAGSLPWLQKLNDSFDQIIMDRYNYSSNFVYFSPIKNY